ncbi:MAG: IPT/TIG domain-containing protein [Bacteroidota bacterium]|jgi:hypothetical protein
MSGRILVSLLFATMFIISACDDQGDPVSANIATPAITSVSPDSGKATDTITVVGTNFGTSGTVSFGSTAATVYASWNATQIKVIIPAGVSSGTVNITVTVSGKTSNAKSFKSIAAPISFASAILPLFTGATYGCTGCHGGQNNLSLDTYNNVLSGNSGYSTAAASDHGPVITPGNATASVLVKKLRTATLPFGGRMPFGGSQMSDADLQKIVDWINQGALNN